MTRTRAYFKVCSWCHLFLWEKFSLQDEVGRRAPAPPQRSPSTRLSTSSNVSSYTSFCGFVRPCMTPSHKPFGHHRGWTVMCIFIKFGWKVNLEERMNPIESEGQGECFWDQTVECILSESAYLLPMAKGWTLLIFRVRSHLGQGHSG